MTQFFYFKHGKCWELPFDQKKTKRCFSLPGNQRGSGGARQIPAILLREAAPSICNSHEHVGTCLCLLVKRSCLSSRELFERSKVVEIRDQENYIKWYQMRLIVVIEFRWVRWWWYPFQGSPNKGNFVFNLKKPTKYVRHQQSLKYTE